MTPIAKDGNQLIAWRLDREIYASSWDSGVGAWQQGGRWNRVFQWAVYASLDPATTVTRHGRTVVYVVSEYDYRAAQVVIQDRANAVRWYDDYVIALKNERSPITPRITPEEIMQLMNEHRA